jgi:hypothetical protein
LTIAAGQKIYVSASRAMGTTDPSGAGGLSLWVGYRRSGSSSIATMGGGMLGNRAAPNSRSIFAISGVISGLPAGTYDVGMVGGSTSTAWNSNSTGYTSSLVFN